jgi:hypothetical protein
MASRLGRRGGRARARRLPADARRRIASLGAVARRQSLQAARRVADNFGYLEAVIELQGGRPALTRMRSFPGPLPGLYRGRV